MDSTLWGECIRMVLGVIGVDTHSIMGVYTHMIVGVFVS